MYRQYLIPTKSVEVGGIWKCLTKLVDDDIVGSLIIGVVPHIKTKAHTQGCFEPQFLYLTSTEINPLPVQAHWYISECANPELAFKPFCYICDSPDFEDCVVVMIDGKLHTTTKHIFRTAYEILLSNDGSDDHSQLRDEYIQEYVKRYNKLNVEIDNKLPLMMKIKLNTNNNAIEDKQYANVQHANVQDEIKTTFPPIKLGEGLKTFLEPYLVSLTHDVSEAIENKRGFDVRDWLDKTF